MRADRDDWEGKHQAKGASPWLILAGASAIIWILVTMYAKPIVINVDKIKEAISWNGKPLTKEKPVPIQHYQNATNPTAQSLGADVEELKRQALQHLIRQEQIKQQQSIKQRSFNENNYVPQPIVNTASFQPTSVERRERSRTVTVRGIDLEKRIEDHCPGREGSIERRECRMRWALESRNK